MFLTWLNKRRFDPSRPASGRLPARSGHLESLAECPLQAGWTRSESLSNGLLRKSSRRSRRTMVATPNGWTFGVKLNDQRAGTLTKMTSDF